MTAHPFPAHQPSGQLPPTCDECAPPPGPQSPEPPGRHPDTQLGALGRCCREHIFVLGAAAEVSVPASPLPLLSRGCACDMRQRCCSAHQAEGLCGECEPISPAPEPLVPQRHSPTQSGERGNSCNEGTFVPDTAAGPLVSASPLRLDLSSAGPTTPVGGRSMPPEGSCDETAPGFSPQSAEPPPRHSTAPSESLGRRCRQHTFVPRTAVGTSVPVGSLRRLSPSESGRLRCGPSDDGASAGESLR